MFLNHDLLKKKNRKADAWGSPKKKWFKHSGGGVHVLVLFKSERSPR